MADATSGCRQGSSYLHIRANIVDSTISCPKILDWHITVENLNYWVDKRTIVQHECEVPALSQRSWNHWSRKPF